MDHTFHFCSFQNSRKKYFKKNCKKYYTIIEFGGFAAPSQVPNPTQIDKKSIKDEDKMQSEFDHHLDVHFWSILARFGGPKLAENRQKMGPQMMLKIDAKKGPQKSTREVQRGCGKMPRIPCWLL